MKKLLIGLSVVLCLCVVGGASILRYGFININVTKYAYQPGETRQWDEILRHPGRFELAVWETGRVLARSRRTFVNTDHPAAAQIKEKGSVPVLAYYLKHPDHGELLIDAGFNQSFAHNPLGDYLLIGKLYASLSGVTNQQVAGTDLGTRLREQRVRLSYVFLTHLHFDHTAGLRTVDPQCRIIAGKGEINFAAKATSGHYLARFKQIEEIDFSKATAIPPFEKVVDCFGDGSLWAISTPGHTAGHVSYLALTTEGPVLFTGDACFYYDALKLGVGPFTQDPGDRELGQSTLERIKTFVEAHPQVRVYVGHDDPL